MTNKMINIKNDAIMREKNIVDKTTTYIDGEVVG